MEQYMRTYDSYAPATTTGYVPTGRIQVMNSVYLPASDIDFTSGQLQPDRLRRRRTQGMRLEQERLDREEAKLKETLSRENAKGGVRVSLRAMLIAVSVTLFFCGFYLLTQQGIIAECQKSINRVNKDIDKSARENETLEASIAEACSEAKVCYAASKNLNMIRSEEVSAIHLSALDTRPMGETDQGGGGLAQTADSQTQIFITARSGGAEATASAAH